MHIRLGFGIGGMTAKTDSCALALSLGLRTIPADTNRYLQVTDGKTGGDGSVLAFPV